MFRFRPRLRFSLRTLLVLVPVAGMGLGWITNSLNWIRQRDAAVRQQEEDSLEFIRELTRHTAHAKPEFRWQPAPWSLRLFAAQGYLEILVARSRATQEGISELQRLFPEAEIQVIDFPKRAPPPPPPAS